MEHCEGHLALVTGASSGIGLCFCRELARRGCNLVMVSNQTCLEECAEEISEEFGVSTCPFFCDLTTDDSAARILDFLDSQNLEPDYLINNAGIFSFKEVTATDPDKVRCFIDLHIRAVTELSRAFAIRFSERGRGRILNMSSMSCWMPMPGIAMYSATKAYIRAFSRALRIEVKELGVSVTVACPGGIATNLFGLPPKLQRLGVKLHALDTPQRFVKKALRRTLQGRAQYINGGLNRMAIVAVASLPEWARLIIKTRLLDRINQ